MAGCYVCVKYFMNASPACFNFFNDFFQGMIANETLGYFIARIQLFLILVRKLNLKCCDFLSIFSKLIYVSL